MSGSAAILLAATLCAPGCGSSRERTEHLDSLVQAERAFAAACSAQGTKAGFLAHLAGDGVVFRPRPVNGFEWYTRSGDSGGRLAWKPMYADVSASADLGYTTGPWEYLDEESRAVGHGEYVSVWRKQPGAVWKVAIDAGISHAAPADRDDTRSAVPARAAAGVASGSDSAGGKAERRRLSEVSQKFFRAWGAGGMEAAYREIASDDVLVLREAELPVRGRSAAIPIVRNEETPARIEAMGGALAGSGDLGYTYGVIGWGPALGGQAREASYLWVWKRARGGEWKIVVDLMVPCEPEAGADG